MVDLKVITIIVFFSLVLIGIVGGINSVFSLLVPMLMSFVAIYLWSKRGTKYSNRENKILLKSLYNHKLWITKIENKVFSLHTIPFVNLIPIKNSLAHPKSDSKLDIKIMSLLENYLLNVNQLEYQIQVLRIKFEHKQLIEDSIMEHLEIKVKQIELILNELLISMEGVVEKGKPLYFIRYKFDKPLDYYKKKVEKNLTKKKNQKIDVTHNEFVCLNCKSVFVGAICPSCESKLKYSVNLKF